MPPALIYLAAFSAVALLSAAAGVWFTGLPEVSRKLIPLSGAVLLGISVLWVLPELAEAFGWSMATALMLAGAAIVGVVDRYIYPICPTCSHTHNHDSCGMRLHGFATPVIAAALLHSLFDGWAFTASKSLSAAVAIHKVPEGLALGIILRAALKSRRAAVTWAGVTQMATLLGGVLELAAAPYLGSTWIAYVLAAGGGMFAYLGGHAMHGEWKRRTAARRVEIS